MNLTILNPASSPKIKIWTAAIIINFIVKHHVLRTYQCRVDLLHENIENYQYVCFPCYVHTQLFLALYMCVFILNGFPLWLFLELDSLLWSVVLEVSGPFYNLITRSYATNFNMNFLEVSLLL